MYYWERIHDLRHGEKKLLLTRDDISLNHTFSFHNFLSNSFLQTLLNATPPKDQINQFIKITVIFELIQWRNFNILRGLEWVLPSKRGGMDRIFQGLAGLPGGISQGAALPAQEKPHPSPLFYLDSHSISKRFSQLCKMATVCRAGNFCYEVK